MIGTMFEDTMRAPMSMILADKSEILKYHAEKEPIRLKKKEFLKQKERVDAINTIKNLIDEWEIKPNEILDCEKSDEYFLIPNEEPYGPDYSQEALEYSINVHEALGFDFKCKECVVRATCCNFDNIDRLRISGECDGITQLLDAGIIKDIEDFYLDKKYN